MKPNSLYSYQSIHAALILAVLGSLPSSPVSAAEPGKTAMPANDVATLYRGKTWDWTDGGGYFGPDSMFKAWSGTGDKASYAEGRWSVTKSGRLCMKATWHVGRRGKVNTTCFAHRVDGDAIYQRKLPAGKWYAFRSAPPKPDDEFMKLKDGDLAGENVAKIKLSKK